MSRAPRTPRVCHYPVFTREEASKLHAEALAISASVEELIRLKLGLDKAIPTVPRGFPGRPPLPPEEREKREALKPILSKLRRWAAYDLACCDAQFRLRQRTAAWLLQRYAAGVDEPTWENYHRLEEVVTAQPRRYLEVTLPVSDWPKRGLPVPLDKEENPLRDARDAWLASQQEKSAPSPTVKKKKRAS